MSLAAFRFIEILTTIHNARAKQERQEYEHAAFVSWQLIEFLKPTFYKDPKPLSFEKYLQQIGVKEKIKTTKEEREAEIQRKLKKAEQIRANDNPERAVNENG